MIVILIILFLAFALYYFWPPNADLIKHLYQENLNWVYPGVPAQFIDIDGFKIRYAWVKRDTDKPVLVFIHGLAASAYCWRNMYSEFLDQYSVLVFDLPGFGYSSKTEKSQYDLDTQSNRIIELLKKLNIVDFYLIGHSMGGVLAAWLAQKYPKNVIKVSLVAPGFSHYFKHMPRPLILFMAHVLKYFIVTKQLVDWILRFNQTQKMDSDYETVVLQNYLPYHKSPAAVITFVKSTELLADSRINIMFRDYEMPVQIIQGSRDRVVLNSAIKRFLKENPGAQSSLIKGAGHFLIIENGKEVAKQINLFFKNPRG